MQIDRKKDCFIHTKLNCMYQKCTLNFKIYNADWPKKGLFYAYITYIFVHTLSLN